MNERIRELAEKSGFFPVPDDTESDWEYRAENARYEKFAELIVRECADISDASFHNGSAGFLAIKKHFGLE